jgi:hypothetical protein
MLKTFIRIQREGVWCNVELENLTMEEEKEFYSSLTSTNPPYVHMPAKQWIKLVHIITMCANKKGICENGNSKKRK